VRLSVPIPELAFWNGGRYKVDDGRYWIQVADSAGGGDVRLQRPVRVRGRLTPLPSVVSASPTMPGDAGRRIQSRLMFPSHTVVIPNLTVAMTDASLHHHIGAHANGLPRRTRVSFRSDHPGIVSVGRDGTIRTLRDGVATITATVRSHRTRRSTQFVVRVVSELGQLTVGGRALPGFHPDAYDYDVIVPRRARGPLVRASSPDRQARVHVGQAGVPGTARITVTGPDGITSRYAVHLARTARSDEFNGRLGHQWKWIRRDPAREHMTGGSVVIAPEIGDFNGDLNTARNILVQRALGNWTIQSKLTFSTPPSAETQQAGIIAYQDDADYLKLDWEYSGGQARLAETTADSLSGGLTDQVLATVPTAGRFGNTVWLRLVKRGPHYTAYYSSDGVHFAQLYGVGASLQDVKVGLFAWTGAQFSNDLQVAFDYFHVRNFGTTIGGRGRVRGRAAVAVGTAAAPRFGRGSSASSQTTRGSPANPASPATGGPAPATTGSGAVSRPKPS
jgi:regulation of enolase protein 1 (concanavalin A-like superfamily)